MRHASAGFRLPHTSRHRLLRSTSSEPRGDPPGASSLTRSLPGLYALGCLVSVPDTHEHCEREASALDAFLPGLLRVFWNI